MQTKMEYNTKPRITDEELEPYNDLFEQAKSDFQTEMPKIQIVKALADNLKDRGFAEKKICHAIVQRFSIPNEFGTVFVHKDYVMRNLPSSMKDYTFAKKPPSGGKTRRKVQSKDDSSKLSELTPEQIAALDKKKEEEKEAVTEEKKIVTRKSMKPPLKTLIETDIKKEIELGKSRGIETPVLDNVEDTETETEIEIDTELTETIIESPPFALDRGAVVDKNGEMLKAKQQEINDLQGQLQMALVQIDTLSQKDNAISQSLTELKEDYSKLYNEYNRVSKPFTERMWIQMNTPVPDGGKPLSALAEIDVVAKPVDRRAQIPVHPTDPQRYKRYIKLQDKDAREQDWLEQSKGKHSIDVKIKPKATTTDKSLQ